MKVTEIMFLCRGGYRLIVISLQCCDCFIPLMKLCFIVLCTLMNTTDSETVQDHGNDVDCFPLTCVVPRVCVVTVYYWICDRTSLFVFSQVYLTWQSRWIIDARHASRLWCTVKVCAVPHIIVNSESWVCVKLFLLIALGLHKEDTDSFLE